jgi:hypothetical protein
VGDSGKILTSSDGVTWAAKSSGTANWLGSVTYGADKFLAVGNFGTILALNADSVAISRKPDINISSGRLSIIPCNGLIKISLAKILSSLPYKVRIFSIPGKTAYTANLFLHNGKLSIPTNWLPEGSYIVSVTAKELTVSSKVILVQ